MTRRTRALLVLAVMASGCAPVRRVTLLTTTVPLRDGRFTGPVEVNVPRHADHAGHDFEVRVQLTAACTPLLTLAFPDGEQQPLGVKDTAWQTLLHARAAVTDEVREQPVAPPPSSNAPEWNEAPVPPPPPAEAGVEVQVVVPAPTVGRWERRLTETWPGQLEFQTQRQQRCAATRTFTATYLNAFDDTNTVALWAEVPQELRGATLTVEVVELIPPERPAPKSVEVKAEVKVVAQTPPKPRPPQPAPKKESPSPAKDAGARWQAGYWQWQEYGGRWVWVPGYWGRPSGTPALRVESPGAPPIDGCRWQHGHWVWVQGMGEWNWVEGHWLAPPPLDEPRGEPPDATSSWQEGRWLRAGATFKWSPGSWSRPQPRAEVRPPPPWTGARWIPGAWVLVAGRWEWSAGFFVGTERPPPPRDEVIPPQPHAGAVWLKGFWRWNLTTREHDWVDGHWEIPPGEDYVWVEEKLGPDLVIGGHWEIMVRP